MADVVLGDFRGRAPGPAVYPQHHRRLGRRALGKIQIDKQGFSVHGGIGQVGHGFDGELGMGAPQRQQGDEQGQEQGSGRFHGSDLGWMTRHGVTLGVLAERRKRFRFFSGATVSPDRHPAVGASFRGNPGLFEGFRKYLYELWAVA